MKYSIIIHKRQKIIDILFLGVYVGCIFGGDNLISFVHLSDIHFNKNSGDQYDVDNDLRNELLMDIENSYLEQIDKTEGVLICGDIAFSGKVEEYATAKSFLDQICEIIGIEKSAVFCVPGNHDIDQDIANKEPAIKLLQTNLATQKGQVKYDDELAKTFRAEETAKLLYLPLKEYNNSFAEQYKCGVLQGEYEWRHEIAFSEKYKLCILGMNSTIISNSDDHSTTSERLMRIGNIQIPRRERGIIYLSLCHHPVECWDDATGELANKMNERVAVQLYGHKHLQTIEMNGNSLVIGSGATHPSRWEPGWVPRYNWLQLELDESNNKDILKVRIYPRIYSETLNKFICDYAITKELESVEYEIILENRCGIENTTDKVNPLIEQYQVSEKEVKIEVLTDEEIRKIIYDFVNLPYIYRCDVLKNCGLEKPEYEGKRHYEILMDAFEKEGNSVVAKKVKEEIEKLVRKEF